MGKCQLIEHKLLLRASTNLQSFFFHIGLAENDIKVSITIDNDGSLTTDTGVVHENNGNWQKAEHVHIPGNTKWVEIKAQNPGDVGGILASFSNGVVTDESWQCADVSEASKPVWGQAVGYGYNNKDTEPWGRVNGGKAIPEIESRAQWIWVSDRYAETVLCMKNFCK